MSLNALSPSANDVEMIWVAKGKDALTNGMEEQSLKPSSCQVITASVTNSAQMKSSASEVHLPLTENRRRHTMVGGGQNNFRIRNFFVAVSSSSQSGSGADEDKESAQTMRHPERIRHSSRRFTN